LNALLNGLSAKLPSFPEIRERLLLDLADNGAHVLHKELLTCDCISAKRIHQNDSYRVMRGLEIFRGTGRTWSDLIREHREQQDVRFENILTIGLTRERSSLYERIEQRSMLMMENGFEEEVRWLLDKGYSHKLKSMGSIGYSHMTKYISGEYDRGKMLELLTRDTRRYAKRQYTWFNKIKEIEWLKNKETDRVKNLIGSFLRQDD